MEEVTRVAAVGVKFVQEILWTEKAWALCGDNSKANATNCRRIILTMIVGFLRGN